MPLPKALATSGEFGLACAANRVAVRTIVPPFAFASADYTPSTQQWRRLPPAPYDPLGRPWLGIGNVVVIAAATDVPPGAHVETLDLSQPVPRWRTSAATLAPSGPAMGVHPHGHVIEQLGESLVELVVPQS